jgi:protease I
VDEELVICMAASPTIVTSRKPDDLPVFCGALVDVFAHEPAPA